MAPRSRASDALAGQDFRHVIGGDLLRQPFDDGGLAHAGFADQHRVVLGAPAKDLDHAQDFGIAPDDRVQLAFARQLGQVAREALQGAVARLGLRVGDTLPAADLLDGFVDPLAGDAGAFQQAGGGRAALAQDGQEDVLGGDIFVFQAVGFFVGQVDNALDARGDENLPGAAAKDIGLRAGAQDVIQALGQSAVYLLLSVSRIWGITPEAVRSSASRMCSVSIWLCP